MATGGKISRSAWPALPLAGWQATYDTLHMWVQIVGKTRIALAPMENHWWQVAFYVSARGLTTSAIPCGERMFSVEFDFIDHTLMLRTSDGGTRAISLVPRTVADFYAEYQAALHALGLNFKSHGSPNEVITAIPFASDVEHAPAQWPK